MAEKFKKISKPKALLHILALFALFVLGDLLGSLPFDILYLQFNIEIAAFSYLRFLLAIAFTYYFFNLYTTKVLKMKMLDFRVTKIFVKAEDIAISLLLPICVLFVYVILGEAFFNGNMAVNDIVAIVLTALLMGLKAGILEEILFRGFIMGFLEAKWNKFVAIIVPSLLFGVVHVFSMSEFNIVSFLLLLCAGTFVGIMFSLVAYKNGSIWGSALIHALWNILIISNIVHVVNGENASDNAIISIVYSSDNVLLTGGAFGIEASVFAVLGYILVCCFALMKIKNKKTRSSTF